jgi:hypothetical protein
VRELGEAREEESEVREVEEEEVDCGEGKDEARRIDCEERGETGAETEVEDGDEDEGMEEEEEEEDERD